MGSSSWAAARGAPAMASASIGSIQFARRLDWFITSLPGRGEDDTWLMPILYRLRRPAETTAGTRLASYREEGRRIRLTGPTLRDEFTSWTVGPLAGSP